MVQAIDFHDIDQRNQKHHQPQQEMLQANDFP
jgi:hypothetical protein